MIPSTSTIFSEELVTQSFPSLTYKMTGGRIEGLTDGIEAVKQAAYKILNTERYDFAIYSWNYGAELNSLYGKPKDYIYSELQRRITEALAQDDRITEVTDFSFETTGKNSIVVSFTIETIYGAVQTAQEVKI